MVGANAVGPCQPDATKTKEIIWQRGAAQRASMGRVNQWPIFRDVPGEPSIRYGKLLTRLTGCRKARKMATIQAFFRMARPKQRRPECCLWAANVEPGGSGSPFVSSAQALG